jgi:hypothetical protein
MIEAITHKMHGDKLIWFGTRGTDSQALLQIPNFKAVFSIIAPLDAISLDEEICLEVKKCKRVDLDRYRIDDDKSEEAQELHSRIYSVLGEPAYLAFYRSSNFLSSIYFPRSNNVKYLGLFHEIQGSFDYKPWVEWGLKKYDVPMINWTYLMENDLSVILEHLDSGPVVMRANRSDGGAELALIKSSAEIMNFKWRKEDGFLSVGPYLYPNIPLNVNGCVYPNKRVTLHSPSLQLIGLQGITNRIFGYCGNDFARIRDLGEDVVNQLEDIAIRCGHWLADNSYIGAFGVDALLFEGKVYLTEINPRFQGSSDLSSRIDQELERPDMFLNHLSAYLGIEDVEETPRPSLWDLASNQAEIAQVVVHNTGDKPRLRKNEYPEDDHLELMLLPRQGIEVMPEAILFRAVASERVTETGGQLTGDYSTRLKSLVDKLFTES